MMGENGGRRDGIASEQDMEVRVWIYSSIPHGVFVAGKGRVRARMWRP